MRARVGELRANRVPRFMIRIGNAIQRARCEILGRFKLRELIEQAQHLFDRVETLLKLFTGGHSKYLVQLT